MGGGNLTGLGVSPAGRGLSPRGRGKPSSSSGSSSSGSVYPRVGGGNAVAGIGPGQDNGLSPRGRGKRGNSHSTTAYHRSIPAWAGETTSPSSRFCPRTVYPRVGGGNATLVQAVPVVWGLSPRGRGKRVSLFSQFTQHGSIPAWAGETHRPAWRRPGGWVYPRVGGGNACAAASASARAGLSPRGRGKLVPVLLGPAVYRSIPAWAGETLSRRLWGPLPPVYPRVGGGNHVSEVGCVLPTGLSPRGRGKRCQGGYVGLCRRSIPAWAGETTSRKSAVCSQPVYPRVGGGNLF